MYRAEYRRRSLSLVVTVILCQVLAAESTSPEVAREHLIAYYPCDEAADGVAVDLSGSGVKSLYSGRTPSLVNGLLGKALYCRGAGDEDVFRYGLKLGTDDYTISFWTRISGFERRHDLGGGAGRGCVVHGYSPRLFVLVDDHGGMSLEMPDANGAAMRTNVTPPRSRWTHLAFVVDRDRNDGCKIYMNGVEQPLSRVDVARGSATRYDMTVGFMFGRALIGKMDEFRVHGKALSAKEISALYAAGAAHLPSPSRNGQVVVDGKWRYVRTGEELVAICPTVAAGHQQLNLGHCWTGFPPSNGPLIKHHAGGNAVRCVSPDGLTWAGQSDGEATRWRGKSGVAAAVKLGYGSVLAMHGDQLTGQSQYLHAMLWRDGTEDGFVDLMIRRAQRSAAVGTVGSTQVGWAYFGRTDRKQVGIIWHGDSSYGYFSTVNGLPVHKGLIFSCMEGTGDDAAIGGNITVQGETPHALLGIGKVDAAPTGPNPAGRDISDFGGIKWTIMNPDDAQSSFITAVSGGRQVGVVVFDGSTHAGLWSGSADSFVDLHPLLNRSGDDWVSSAAAGVYSDGDELWIVGSGKDLNGSSHGFVLYGKSALPEPRWRPERRGWSPDRVNASPALADIELPCKQDLLCYFRLDRAIGRRAPDATGNSRDAVYRGASPGDACGTVNTRLKPTVRSVYSDLFPSLVPGLFGKALRCYGGGFQDVLKRKGLKLGKDDFTLSFWVNPTEYNLGIDFGGGAGRGTVVTGRAKDNPQHRLSVMLDDNGKITLSMLDNGEAKITAAHAPAKGLWSHIAIVVDRDNNAASKIHVNGEEASLIAAEITKLARVDYNLDVLLFGQALVGDLDDFVVYRRALDPDNVRAIFASAPADRLGPTVARLPDKYLGRPIRPRRWPYRIIYNMDSSGHLYGYNAIAAKNVEEYLRSTADFLEGTHVDMVSWCDGSSGNVASWDSEVMELTGARVGRVDPFLLQLIREGHDPARIVISAVHKMGVDIFYSFRLNDPHDSKGNPPHFAELLSTFKEQHPEWTLGEGHPYGGSRQLNFATPEVRDFKFNVIQEVFGKYDFDGLEVDFLRSPPYFIPGKEPDNAHHLTGLLRRIRKHLRERGDERGRPIRLLVRVDESLQACQLDGFDVATWIQEDLVDMVALGSGAKDIEVQDFKALAEGSNTLIYACPYSTKPAEVYAALATNYLSQGADGMYTFNWGAHYSHIANEFLYQRDMLSVIDDPAALRGRDKVFAADTGRPNWVYPHNWMYCVLPAALEVGKQLVVPVMVAEDFSRGPSPRSIELAVKAVGDVSVDVELNGKTVSGLERSDSGLSAQLRPEQLVCGRNTLRFSANSGSVKISSAEIRVDYD